MIDWYDWPGGREAMLRFGPADGPVVVVASPLFEEWNRTRAFVVTLLRALAVRGVGSVLPDLPGHGESLVAVETLTLLRMAEAFEALTDTLAAARRTVIGVGLRSGTLVDGRAPLFARWHLAPMTGAEVLTDLHRTWLAGECRPPDRRSLDAMMYDADQVAIGGTTMSADLLASLTYAEPFDRPPIPRRVVRLATDPRPADRKVAGKPLWRSAEPGNDPALAATLAHDIAAWVTTCAA